MLGLADFEAASKRLQGVIRPTPTQRSESLSAIAGRPVLIKPEHLQRTGSFKIRGAYNFLSACPAASDRLIVAASAGNHAQGVALAASLLGLRSVIFMPQAASIPKIDATRGYGAEVRLAGGGTDEAIMEAIGFAKDHGAVYVPPFDDPLVIAGQGTIGLELAGEAPDAEAVVVPVGGGGLISGIAACLARANPGARVIGVEAEGAAAMRQSLDAGRLVTLDAVTTMADGIALKSVCDLTLGSVRAFVDDIVTVSEEEISRSLLLLLERAKSVVEPAGAVGLAAVLAGKVAGKGPVVVVTSGGNIDPLLLMKVIDHGLSAQGRYLRFKVVLSDHPGALASLATALSEMGLNVLAVEHHRAGVEIGIDQVEVFATVETRGPDHAGAVLDALAARGFATDVIR